MCILTDRKVEGKLKGASGSGEFTDELRAAVAEENSRGGTCDDGIVVSECEANYEAGRVIHLNCPPPAIGFDHLAVVLHNNATDEKKGHFFVVKARGKSYSTCPVRIGSDGTETPLISFDFEKAVKEQKCIVGLHRHSVVAVASI